jgi:hypothetical protein
VRRRLIRWWRCGQNDAPSDGAARQTLRKKTGTDFDAGWAADPVVKFKAADETRSSTALADDATLPFDVKNGVTYRCSFAQVAM